MEDNRIRRDHFQYHYLIAIFLAVAGLALLAGCALARRVNYAAPRVEVPSPPPARFEEVAIKEGDEQIVVWLLRFDGGDENTPVLFTLHGNSENLETMRRAGTLDRLGALKAHVFVLDYPGYGRSTGSPNEISVVRAAEKTLTELRSRFPQNPVFVWGWSLGAGVATQVASRNIEKIAGLILISPWTSLPTTAKLHYPPFLIKLFMKDRYDTVKTAPSITVPSMVVHGELDELIPLSQGKAVADALPELVLWLPINGAGHNDVLSFEKVWQKIDWFIHSFLSNG